jgi:hypothetical protein
MHRQVEEGAERHRTHPRSTVFGPETDQDVDCTCGYGKSTWDTISGDQANDPRSVATFERDLIVALHDQIVDAGETVTYTTAVRSRVRCDEDGMILWESGCR